MGAASGAKPCRTEGAQRLLTALLAGGVKSVLGVVGVFVVLVAIHEFGHFIVAKRAGVLAPRFAIGFGPSLWKFVRGETEYSVRLFPIGGFVQLSGEIPQDTFFKTGEAIAVSLNAAGQVELIGDADDLPGGIPGTLSRIDTSRRFRVWIQTDDGPREFALSDPCHLINGKDRIRLAPPSRQMNRKPLLARMAIVLAGPIMNVLLAVVLFSIVAGVVGAVAGAPRIASVEGGSPAARAGLHAGDVIDAVNGRPVANWGQLVTDIQTHPQDTLRMTVERSGGPVKLTITPRKRKSGIGFIGVTPAVSHSIPVAVENGVLQTVGYTQLIFHGLGQLFHSPATFTKDTAGPVKIVAVIGQQAQLGFVNLINLTAILSLNLAIFNMLPIPALDGSRFLFMLVEGVRGKPLDPRKEYLAHAIGFSLLILFMVFRTYLDVTQLF